MNTLLPFTERIQKRFHERIQLPASLKKKAQTDSKALIGKNWYKHLKVERDSVGIDLEKVKYESRRERASEWRFEASTLAPVARFSRRMFFVMV